MQISKFLIKILASTKNAKWNMFFLFWYENMESIRAQGNIQCNKSQLYALESIN